MHRECKADSMVLSCDQPASRRNMAHVGLRCRSPFAQGDRESHLCKMQLTETLHPGIGETMATSPCLIEKKFICFARGNIDGRTKLNIGLTTINRLDKPMTNKCINTMRLYSVCEDGSLPSMQICNLLTFLAYEKVHMNELSWILLFNF
jgi:hypothetical protein